MGIESDGVLKMGKCRRFVARGEEQVAEIEVRFGVAAAG